MLKKSTQNAANLPLQTCDENQWTFLAYDTSVCFNSRINFANIGSLAKVSVPLQFIIPWPKNCVCGSCGTTLSVSHNSHKHSPHPLITTPNTDKPTDWRVFSCIV